MPTARGSISRMLALSISLAGLAATPAIAAINPDDAARVFDEAKVICNRDAGALWGHTLCGPMLLVDPADRSAVANQADAGGVLKASGPVFIGVLPPSEIMANTSIQWSGTRWSEILWPLPENTEKRHVMIAHESFHRIQPDLKMVLHEGDNRHLDTLEGRYLLQLEWRALAKALNATTSADRKVAIGDALLFRSERYRIFPNAAEGEGALESNEGVAEYTGVRLGLPTPKARISYAIGDLSAFVEVPSFVRSFAYATGPAYGLMLDQADPDWRRKLASGQRLDQLLSAALKLPSPAFATLKAREAIYDDGTLRTHEVKREQAKIAHMAALKAKLVDGPVLTLPLKHSNYQFNPQTLQPLGDLGIVYPTMRLTDEWGALDVDGDALVNQEKKVANVSAAGFDPSKLKGAGWSLTLNKGWIVVPGTRKGDVIVQKVEDPGH
ncbi:hypothetical protein [Pinirhizobacter soli]|uniref:hypothetical protein n=1 Tax=Pinirhizobacter soli TaxID=2786953 RepID=UPI00202AB20D|nr:hypothetical protein [Pinirhizobacter soli]